MKKRHINRDLLRQEKTDRTRMATLHARQDVLNLGYRMMFWSSMRRAFWQGPQGLTAEDMKAMKADLGEHFLLVKEEMVKMAGELPTDPAKADSLQVAELMFLVEAWEADSWPALYAKAEEVLRKFSAIVGGMPQSS